MGRPKKTKAEKKRAPKVKLGLAARRGAATRKATRPKTEIKRTPRNANLPGMEGVRDVIKELSDQMSTLTDIRNQMTDLREARAIALSNSLALLQKHRRALYADNGTEVALKPGAPTVVARASKGQSATKPNGKAAEPTPPEPEWDDEEKDANEDLAGISEAASR